MKNLVSSVLVAVLISVSSFTSYGQKTLNKIVKSGEIKVGMTLKQPPYNMRSKSWEMIGYEVDIARLLAESMGVKLNIVELPFHELLPSLESGKIDAVMSGMTITPERNLKAAFVGPYMISGKSILTKNKELSSADEAEDIDMDHIRVAAMKGTTSEKFVSMYIDEASVTLVENYKEGVDLLKSDKIDVMIADYIICMLAAMMYEDEGLIALEEPLTIEPIGIALPADDPLLTNLIENYLNSLSMSGILDELQHYYFEDGSWLLQMKDVKLAPHPTSGPVY